MATFLTWLKTSSTRIREILSFLIGLLSGVWINWLTGGTPMTWRGHALLGLALACLILKLIFDRWVESLDKTLVYDLLKMARFLLADHAKAAVRAEHIRLIVHRRGSAKPGPKIRKQQCLIPQYELSPVTPRDCGVIPLNNEEFKAWYVNLQAFHKQDLICAEPDPNRRPPAPGHYIDTPSLFKGVSVISVPIRSPDRSQILGSLTVDSTFNLNELRWPRSGSEEPMIRDFLFLTADSIGKIQSS